ncbi:MAG: vWA domain-containing protein [Myxococcota bacterium]
MWNKMIGRFGLVAALVPTMAACNSHPLKAVELQSEQEKGGNVSVAINRDVDILFVIDNSRSMAEEQATLARNFGPLIERLEQDDVRANYRIAITTTDNGHIHCNGRDGGRFKTSSCLSRPSDFRARIDDVELDFFDDACASICNYDEIEMLPTTTFADDTPKPRPWIESINGVTNLPEGISPVEAFECLAPQGLTGCGFEAPLESMRESFRRADRDDQPENGFMRPGAILAVIFVTDEADCSAQYSSIADPWDYQNGSKALWSEENRKSGTLTSEVCWFAGVECEEQPDGTKECWAMDKAIDGSEASGEEDAVLYPLERYVDFLNKLEEQKKEINPEQEILVGVLTGVPDDYAGGPIAYSNGTDDDFRLETGIGAGCSSSNGEAAPPVRMAEFADAFRTDDDEVNLFSVCRDDYSASMSAIAEAIGKQVKPPCVETCVADEDPTTDGLQHNCQLEEEFVTPDGKTDSYTIPACLAVDGGFEFPEGRDVCFRSLSDAEERTPTTDDDMSPQCAEEGWNLEVAVERRDDVPPPPGARVQARCSVSRLNAVDCPRLQLE